MGLAVAGIAAGAGVRAAVPPGATVAGVPARIVRRASVGDSSRSADEILRELSYASFDYTI